MNVAPPRYRPFAIPRQFGLEILPDWIAEIGGPPAEDISRAFGLDSALQYQGLARIALYNVLALAAQRIEDVPSWLITPIDTSREDFQSSLRGSQVTADRLAAWQQMQASYWNRPEYHAAPDPDDPDPEQEAPPALGPRPKTYLELVEIYAEQAKNPAEMMRAGRWHQVVDYLLTLDRLVAQPSLWGDTWTTSWHDSYPIPSQLRDPAWPGTLAGDDPWELLLPEHEQEVREKMERDFPYPDSHSGMSDMEVCSWVFDLSGWRWEELVPCTHGDLREQVTEDRRRRLAMVVDLVHQAWQRADDPVQWWQGEDGRAARRAAREGRWLDAVWEVLSIGPTRLPPEISFNDRLSVQVYHLINAFEGPRGDPMSLFPNDRPSSVPYELWHPPRRETREEALQRWVASAHSGSYVPDHWLAS